MIIFVKCLFAKSLLQKNEPLQNAMTRLLIPRIVFVYQIDGGIAQADQIKIGAVVFQNEPGKASLCQNIVLRNRGKGAIGNVDLSHAPFCIGIINSYSRRASGDGTAKHRGVV